MKMIKILPFLIMVANVQGMLAGEPAGGQTAVPVVNTEAVIAQLQEGLKMVSSRGKSPQRFGQAHVRTDLVNLCEKFLEPAAVANLRTAIDVFNRVTNSTGKNNNAICIRDLFNKAIENAKIQAAVANALLLQAVAVSVQPQPAAIQPNAPQVPADAVIQREIDRRLQQEFECPVCMERTQQIDVHEVQGRPHRVCSGCLVAMARRNTQDVRCPMCRAVIPENVVRAAYILAGGAAVQEAQVPAAAPVPNEPQPPHEVVVQDENGEIRECRQQ